MKCEWCESRKGTWYAYYRDGIRHWACRRHRDKLLNLAVTIVFPLPKFYEDFFGR